MFWPFKKQASSDDGRPPLVFYNTLTHKEASFEPLTPGRPVKMYNCGPTVYSEQHIGNLAYAVFVDTLRRTLEYNGYDVQQVMNITDVGHLTSDEDEGEDKMSKGLRAAGLELTLENMRTLGEKYTQAFLDDLKKLNVNVVDVEFPRASQYIDAQVAMIQTLEEKGFTYTTDDGVYYDTSHFPEYGKLGGINIDALKEGARVQTNEQKHNPADFALWKFDEHIGWKSPWGKGFPGWHIECSAMIRSLLGPQIDIHTGGIEHIPVHHNNEIAQSEAALGKKPFVHYWLHREHLLVDGTKIAKSTGSCVYLSDLVKRGFHPLAFRYFLLNAHYRSPVNFTESALGAAQTALGRLLRVVLATKEVGEINLEYKGAFLSHMNNDLDTPGALAVVWQLVKNNEVSPEDKRATLLDFERVLGLGLAYPDEKLKQLAGGTVVDIDALPTDIQQLVREREAARAQKNWNRADELRSTLEARGYGIEDGPDGSLISTQ